MCGHPRGVYWADLLEAQRTAAEGLGFTQTSWDEGAPPPVLDPAVLQRKEEAPASLDPASIVITLDNLGDQSVFNMRQWLQHRNAYDEQKHGPPGSKTFTKLITAQLVDEQRERERQRLEQLTLQQHGLKAELVAAKQKRKAAAVVRSLLRQQDALRTCTGRFDVRNCIKRVRIAHFTGRSVNALDDGSGGIDNSNGGDTPAAATAAAAAAE